MTWLESRRRATRRASARRVCSGRIPAPLLLLIVAVGGASDGAGAEPATRSGCREIAAGSDLAAVLESAPADGSLCLAPGVYDGPIRIGERTTLRGPRDAVIRSTGEGTTVRLEANGAALVGITVDGSGGRFDLLDAAVHVQAADARVEGVQVRNAVFGILVERSERALVKGNEVIGDPSQPLGLRGDSIRLWETQHSRVEDNLVRDGRDVVVWYSSDNRIEGNRVERSRYGTHLMYSHRNRIEANHFVGNVTGLFLMYSRDIDVVDNVIAGSAGSAGIGLGLKESGNLRVVANDFVRNTVGIYVDLSPLWPDDHNVFERNVIRLGDAGIVFLGATARNEFRENVLRDNLVSVRVDGGDDALAASWRRNDFDDYVGYDLDGDGTGDVPYELRSLSSELVSRSPALAFLRGTPALGFAEAIGRVVPLFEPKLLLVDPEPRTGPPPEARLAR